jgi:uncharacterized protein
MLLNGEGAPREPQAGGDWTRKAAAQSHAGAQKNVGWMYHEGVGVAKEFGTAAQWFRKSAEQGNAVAQRNLGLMLLAGRGVAADPALGAVWLNKAAAQGDTEAQKALASTREGSPRQADEPLAAEGPPTGSLTEVAVLKPGGVERGGDAPTLFG